MSRDDFDLGPLTWVKGEIDQALASVLEQLAIFSSRPEEVSPVRFMLTHLHQVNGALDMVGLEGARLFCQELEAMADAFAAQQLACSADVADTFSNGIRTLSAYLDDLVNGAPDIPLHLYPALAALMQAQGKAPVEESALFFPDTSVRAPSDLPSIELDADALAEHLSQQRRFFQRALVNWLQQGAAEQIAEMRTVVESVMQSQRLPLHKTLWWVAGGALDSISHEGGKTAGPKAIRIFRRLDQQLRNLVEGNSKPANALLRDLLFQIARSEPVSERILQVSRRFELEDLLPGADQAGSHARPPGVESAALAALRAAMPSLQELWTAAAAAGEGSLAAMTVALQALEPSRQGLSNAVLGDLLLNVSMTVQQLSENPATLTDARSLDVASALTLFESALANYAYLGEAFVQQATAQIAHLRQSPASEETAIPAVLDVSTLMAVGQEIKSILSQVEKTLDLYFRSPDQQDALSGLQNPLHQVAGAFEMLELPAASALTHACGRLVAWFSTRKSAPETVYFEKIAESLSALGALVDAATHAGPDAEQPIRPLLDGLEALLAQLEPVSQPAAKKAAKPRVRTRKVTDRAIDAELLEIYLTEADEVLSTIASYLDELRTHPDSVVALAEVRRGFHTLKGSGRTVGLTALGEVAWLAEQLLNRRIENKAVPSVPEQGFVAEVHAAFTEWIARLQAEGGVSIEPERWKEKAANLECVPATAVSPIASSPASEKEVVIGGALRISQTLFDLFRAEAEQNLGFLEQTVHAAERQPDANLLQDCLRAAHTLAGTSKTTGLIPLATVAGALEAWLEAFQHQPHAWNAEAWHVMGRAVLSLRLMLTRVAVLRKPRYEYSALNALQVLPPAMPAISQPPVQPSAESAAAPIPAVPVSTERRLLDIFLEEARELFPLVGSELREWRARPGDVEPPRSLQRALHTLKGGARMAGEAVLGDAIHELETRVIQVLKTRPAESDFDQMFAELDDISRQMEVFDAGTASDLPATTQQEMPLPIAQSLRVRADVLDELVNEAGEISISRSRIEREMGMFKRSLQELTESVTRLRSHLRELEIEADSRMQSRETLLQETGEAFDPLEFDRYTRLQELTRMMAESVNDVATTQHTLLDNLDETESALQDQMRMNRSLQQELMHIRMIPFSAVSERLHRIVRQTAREVGNRVELSIQGAQVEIDRSVLEKIVAPLEHLLRNAIAHGIEPAEKRVSAGKPENGHIALAVRQEKNEIVIHVTDDGAGINLDRVRHRAVERGLFKKGQKVAEQALMAVIFEPGFSTSSEVTQVSGRGVGLDVVRNDISMLGGRIDVASQAGQGASFTVYLPTTLTVLQVVLVRAGSHVFAVPAVMVEQVQQLKADVVNAGYEAGHLPWSGREYPMHFLPRLVGDTAAMPDAQRSSPVVLLRSGTYHIALHVDEIVGNQEVVVKRIGPQLTLVPGIVGATVLGDGKIMLIVNPVQLANRAVLAAGTIHVSAAPASAEQVKTVLVVDDSLTMRKVLGRLLMREGYRVLTARDGLEAMQMVQEALPDAVVLDIEMPRMDGFELARNLRDDPRTVRLPLIVVSSRTAEKHRALARDIGINAYLGKPVQDEELLSHLGDLLGKAFRET